jgi:hypothetical protein
MPQQQANTAIFGNYDKAKIFSMLGQAGREEILSDNVIYLQTKVLRIAFLFRSILRYTAKQFRRRESSCVL